jgi:hypothetical protein|tara:strand:+ start:3012 stop:3425 length:414 start_codon:yes stop_codon:yes gene_type:complete
MEEKKSNKSKKKATKPTKKPRSKGLGDTVEKITKATGIKAVVKAFTDATGIDCGCDKRKETLNKLFRYSQPECLVKEEHEYLKQVLPKNVILAEEQEVINKIFNRIFHKNVQVTSCGSCLQSRIDQLKQIFETYGNE